MVCDRLHWRNHTHCSTLFRMWEYSVYSEWIRKMNSQVCEQRNRLLRRLASVVSHSSVRNAVASVRSFLAQAARVTLVNMGKDPSAWVVPQVQEEQEEDGKDKQPAPEQLEEEEEEEEEGED